MEATMKKATASRGTAKSKPRGSNMKISEADIRTRAFEIYLSNMNSTSNEMDDWLYAEKELVGKNK